MKAKKDLGRRADARLPKPLREGKERNQKEAENLTITRWSSRCRQRRPPWCHRRRCRPWCCHPPCCRQRWCHSSCHPQCCHQRWCRPPCHRWYCCRWWYHWLMGGGVVGGAGAVVVAAVGCAARQSAYAQDGRQGQRKKPYFLHLLFHKYYLQSVSKERRRSRRPGTAWPTPPFADSLPLKAETNLKEQRCSQKVYRWRQGVFNRGQTGVDGAWAGWYHGGITARKDGALCPNGWTTRYSMRSIPRPSWTPMPMESAIFRESSTSLTTSKIWAATPSGSTPALFPPFLTPATTWRTTTTPHPATEPTRISSACFRRPTAGAPCAAGPGARAHLCGAPLVQGVHAA